MNDGFWTIRDIMYQQWIRMGYECLTMVSRHEKAMKSLGDSIDIFCWGMTDDANRGATRRRTEHHPKKKQLHQPKYQRQHEQEATLDTICLETPTKPSI